MFRSCYNCHRQDPPHPCHPERSRGTLRLPAPHRRSQPPPHPCHPPHPVIPSAAEGPCVLHVPLPPLSAPTPPPVIPSTAEGPCVSHALQPPPSGSTPPLSSRAQPRDLVFCSCYNRRRQDPPHPCHPERSRGTLRFACATTAALSPHPTPCHPEHSRGTLRFACATTAAVRIHPTPVIPSAAEGPCVLLVLQPPPSGSTSPLSSRAQPRDLAFRMRYNRRREDPPHPCHPERRRGTLRFARATTAAVSPHSTPVIPSAA